MRRNKILRIRGVDEAWIEGEKEVITEMFAHYNNLFKSDREEQGMGQMWDQTMSSIPTQVLGEMNHALCRFVFQMGGGGHGHRDQMVSQDPFTKGTGRS